MAVIFQAAWLHVCVPDSGQKGELLWQTAKMPFVGQKHGHTLVLSLNDPPDPLHLKQTTEVQCLRQTP